MGSNPPVSATNQAVPATTLSRSQFIDEVIDVGTLIAPNAMNSAGQPAVLVPAPLTKVSIGSCWRAGQSGQSLSGVRET